MAYDEAVLIPYWVRHYRAFCQKVVVYVDAATTDGTGMLARREGAEVRYRPAAPLDDLAFVAFAQEGYKEARGKADWVIWVDADEFLYHPRGMGARLEALRREGANDACVQGYQMVAEAPPVGARPITDQIRRGLPAREYSKVCCFDPDLDVSWTPGKHHATVAGDHRRDATADPLRLLHYRYLGHEWMVARNARNYERVDETNRARAHGKETYPGYEGVYSPAWFREQLADAGEVTG